MLSYQEKTRDFLLKVRLNDFLKFKFFQCVVCDIFDYILLQLCRWLSRTKWWAPTVQLRSDATSTSLPLSSSLNQRSTGWVYWKASTALRCPVCPRSAPQIPQLQVCREDRWAQSYHPHTLTLPYRPFKEPFIDSNFLCMCVFRCSALLKWEMALWRCQCLDSEPQIQICTAVRLRSYSLPRTCCSEGTVHSSTSSVRDQTSASVFSVFTQSTQHWVCFWTCLWFHRELRVSRAGGSETDCTPGWWRWGGGWEDSTSQCSCGCSGHTGHSRTPFHHLPPGEVFFLSYFMGWMWSLCWSDQTDQLCQDVTKRVGWICWCWLC